ncbi:Helicase [Macleaya cordata]|uniref:ATP-dependent RNA helicase n=1 Tax=Macleaya cordata TaxID=56857 RepID=A0A200QLW0_MACCD|nr:Helicase [Macleaya cordata]
MPGQLLPLRLLNSSVSATSFSTMKLGANFQSSRGISVFNRVFPFKLKYLGFPRNFAVPVLQHEESGVRSFSTGSFRPRSSSTSSVGRNSEFSRGRGVERENFKAGSFGSRGAKEKSLIEDEDELSDWVSELKTDSFRLGLNKESDDSDMDRGSKRDRDTGRSRDSFSSSKSQRGGRDDSFSRRGRDDFSFSNSRSSRGGRDDSFSSKRGRDDFSGSNSRSSRGGRDDSFSSNRGRDEFSVSKSRSSRGGTGSYSSSRGTSNSMSRGSNSMSNFGSKRRFSESSSEDEGLTPRRREYGSRGAVSSPTTRSGRNSSLSNGRSRGGGILQKGAKPSGRQPLLVSDDEDDDEDDEDDEDSISGFEDLLNDEDSEDSGEDSEESSDEDNLKGLGSLSGLAKGNAAQTIPKVSSGDTGSYLSETRFDQCSISPLSLKGIKDAGYERMTIVQEATLPVILKGKDVLAKARTGTGKTVAFLLPAIEAIVKSPSIDRDQKRPPINVLVICPTRELASQAAAEANTLLKYHPSIGVQVVIGGVRLAMEQKRLQANPCQILIATPGRLRDHTENTAGFATRLTGVKVLVLDEADHLLDMGFRKDIEKIIASVPKQRQTLLFSATVPEEVRQICHIALKRDHEYINTVEEGSQETHSQVRQTHLVAPLDKHFPLLYALLKDHIADDVDYKVLVFCTTAMVTRLVASLLSELNLNVREIHSRKPQSYRTRVSDEFRKSKGLILVTSDVSARGVDYPDVTLVIQVGLPSDREQYIHRLGRTGRKGKEGQGILLLAPWEEFFLSSLRDLPLSKASVPSVDPDTKKKVERALFQVEMKNKEAAYQAWLGFYNSNKTVARDKCKLVELANEFSRSMGLDNPPALPKLVLGKMGLKNVPGLRSK